MQLITNKYRLFFKQLDATPLPVRKIQWLPCVDYQQDCSNCQSGLVTNIHILDSGIMR